MKVHPSPWKRLLWVLALTLLAPHFAKALPLEVVMRAFQERYVLVYGYSGSDPEPDPEEIGYTWPLRVSDNAQPGRYPPDGFYGMDQAESIINQMFYVMFEEYGEGMVVHFTPLKANEIEGRSFIPRYSAASILDRDRPDTEADYITKFDQISRALCKMKVAALQASAFQDERNKVVARARLYNGDTDINTPTNTVATVREAASALWNSSEVPEHNVYMHCYWGTTAGWTPYPFDDWFFIPWAANPYFDSSSEKVSVLELTACDYGTFGAQIQCLRGTIERSLIFKGGNATWYLQAGDISDFGLPGYKGADKTGCPVRPDNFWRRLGPAKSGARSSVVVGDTRAPFHVMEPAKAGTDTLTAVSSGWQLNDQVAIVEPQWQHVLDQKYGFTAECGYECGTCTSTICSPGSLTTSVNSLEVSVGLGHAMHGAYQGLLKLSAGAPGPSLFKPTALSTPGQGDFQTIRDTNGWPRQVLSLQALADIVVVNDFKYQIKFYTFANRGTANAAGVYSPNGNPYATVTVENPDASATVFNRLRVTRAAGGPADVRDFVYTEASDQWSLVTGGGARRESLSTTWNTDNTVRTTVRVVKDAQDKVVSKQRDTFQTFPWGEEQVASVLDPDGAALTTTLSYYEDVLADGNSYGHLKQVVQPTGYWERYEYNAKGRPYKTIAQYLDAPIGAAENASRVTTTTYGASNPVETRVQTLLGQEVSRHYVARLADGATADIQCTVAGAAWDAATNLVTTTRRYAGVSFRGELQSVRRPGGTLTTYAYSLPAGGGKVTVVSTGTPNAAGTAVVDGTSTSTWVDAAGNAVLTTTTDIASGLTLTSATTTQTDGFGRPTQITYEDGSTEFFNYDCCGLQSQTDRDGVTTTYAYDALDRPWMETRGGVTTISGYDAAGRRTSTVREGSDGSRITLETVAYDVAGRQISRTDALGKVTTFTPTFDATSGHLVKTTTHPDNLGVQVETYAKDGSPLSVSGSAAHPASYAYGLDAAGVWQQQTRLGSAGETTEWTKTYTDLAGRPYKTVGANGAVEQSFFNNKGQLVRRVDADGVTTLLAYNDKGEQETSAVDVNRNGVIDYGGTDRISRTQRSVLSAHGGQTVARATTSVWPTLNSATAQVIAVDDATPNGRRTWQERHGLTTQGVTVCDGTGTCTTTVTAPDGSYTLSVTQNGRPSSQGRYNSTGQQLSGTSLLYDHHGRTEKQTDLRTGETLLTYWDNDLLRTSTHAGLKTTYQYDARGRKNLEILPDAGRVSSDYWPTGELKSTGGARTYGQAYTYDAQGRLKTLTTNGAAGAAVTTWNYHPQSGLLASKVYADGKGPSYTFTLAGRPLTRTWARGITATYTPNNAGDLATITYSDGGTPAAAFTYDRLGRLDTAAGGGSARSLAYQSNTSALAGDTFTGGPLAGLSVATGYGDALKRRTSLTLKQNTTTLISQGFGYDNASRLETASQGAVSATYGYLANSAANLTETLTFKHAGSTKLTTTKVYHPHLDRLESIASRAGTLVRSSHAYGYNAAQQRERADLADGTHWRYGHDGLGQLTGASRRWTNDGSTLAGQQFGYTFDAIGNRTSTRVNGRAATYVPNAVNQYAQRAVPGAVDVLGAVLDPQSTVTVTVNDQPTTRQQGGYFHRALAADNAAAALDVPVDVVAVRRDGGPSGENVVGERHGRVFLPRNPEVFVHDDDGNLTRDGRWTYTWDAENRLVGLEARTDVPATAKKKLAFAYDSQGRRVQKQVWNWNAGTNGYQASSTTRFLYEGWNLVAEVDGQNSNQLVRSYLWGLDLSGTAQGAGGVGGLLAVSDHTAQATGAHFAAHDGNGNVVALVKAGDGTLSATYEYGPFGETVRVSDTAIARANPVRWSSKYEDQESGLNYYGYRFYQPQTGRWVSRDPIEERGGVGLYVYALNSPTIHFDGLGRFPFRNPTEKEWNQINTATRAIVTAIGPLLKNIDDYFKAHDSLTPSIEPYRILNYPLRDTFLLTPDPSGRLSTEQAARLYSIRQTLSTLTLIDGYKKFRIACYNPICFKVSGITNLITGTIGLCPQIFDDGSLQDTIAHEGSHALVGTYDYYYVADPSKRFIDAYAYGILLQ